MERCERKRGFFAPRGRIVGRTAATLFALSLSACFGSSAEKDDSDDDNRDGCRLDGECPRGRVCVDIDGNRNDICEGTETCACGTLTPSTGGSGGGGGTSGSGGTSSVGGDGVGANAGEPAVGGSTGVGGSAGTSGCTRDEECARATVCIDDVRGDGDGFCETGEECTCVSVGSGGTGGVGGTGAGGTMIGGTGGRGGGGGNAGANGTALGRPCERAADCGDSRFTCLTSNGLSDGSGPPNGLCTLACTSDEACLALDPRAYCVGFTDAESYCIQECRGGSAGAPKCQLRADFACGILDTTPTTATCLDTNDCGAVEVCVDGVCQNMITACVPTCGGDFDCGSGQFCDFASGLCVPTAPTGLPIGSLCDPTLPDTSDPCNGFCLATDDTNTEGTCAAFCSASASAVGCGWNGQGSAEAGCLFATVVSRDAAGGISLAESDLMMCGSLCNCNADCPAEADLCMDENAGDPTASIQAIFGRGGYCRPLEANETSADSIASCTR